MASSVPYIYSFKLESTHNLEILNNSNCQRMKVGNTKNVIIFHDGNLAKELSDTIFKKSHIIDIASAI